MTAENLCNFIKEINLTVPDAACDPSAVECLQPKKEFGNVMKELLTQMQHLFPSDTNIKSVLDLFEKTYYLKVMRKKIISTYYKEMSPFFTDVYKRNYNIIGDLKVPFMNKLQIATRLTSNDLNDDQKEMLLQNIDKLNAWSIVICCVPKDVFAKAYGMLNDQRFVKNGKLNENFFADPNCLFELIPLHRIGHIFQNASNILFAVKILCGKELEPVICAVEQLLDCLNTQKVPSEKKPVESRGMDPLLRSSNNKTLKGLTSKK